jgi:hypothetical protein
MIMRNKNLTKAGLAAACVAALVLGPTSAAFALPDRIPTGAKDCGTVPVSTEGRAKGTQKHNVDEDWRKFPASSTYKTYTYYSGKKKALTTSVESTDDVASARVFCDW